MGLMLRRMCMMGASATPTPPLIKTVSGALIHITDALAKPAKKFVATLEPIQSGSGDPAPDNVRPITGHTGASVVRTGKNLYPYSTIPVYSYAWYSGSKALADATNPFFLVGGKTYILSYANTDNDAKPLLRVWRADGTILNNEPNTLNALMYQAAAVQKFTYQATPQYYNAPSASNVNACVISLTEDLWIDARMQSGKSEATSVMLAISEIPLTYEPYSGTTIPITFPSSAGTVYGGTLTINDDGSGELTNKLVRFLLDGNLNYQLSYVGMIGDNNASAYTQNLGGIEINKNTTDGYADSLKFKSGGIANIPENGFALESKTRIRVCLSNSLTGIVKGEETTTTAGQKFKAYFTAHPCEIVTELFEPITYTLTAQQVITLLQGENNVWSDAQSIEITYVASANSDDLNAADSLNLLLGNAYTRGDVPDEEALQIIMGETR